MRGRLVLSYLVTVITLGGAVIASGVLTPRSNYYSSNPPLVGKTHLGDSQGCGCHSLGGTITLNGASTTLYPGQAATFTITGSGGTNGVRFGVDIAATGGTLSVTDPALEIASGEIRHKQNGSLATVSGGSASYSFTYTMGTGSSPGTGYTIAADGVMGSPGAWNFAQDLTVTAIRPIDPYGLQAGTPTALSVPLSWSGTGPAYRVVYKTGSYPLSATDGTFTDVATTSKTITGLTGGTTYYFAVYGRATFSAANTFSTNATKVTATTDNYVPKTLYVNPSTGNDVNPGTSPASPLQSLTAALFYSVDGDTISAAPGTYQATNTSNEHFPLTMKSGVKLISSGGPAVTIIDGTSMDQVYGTRGRLMNCNGNLNTTLVQGFTFTGGLDYGNTTGQGGGIFTYNNDATTITGNIFKNNEAQGIQGTQFFTDGGAAYGGGIYADGFTVITNNLFIGNIARGGTGYGGTNFPGNGGDSAGGGVYVYGPATLANNTFVGNQAIGGTGGAEFSNPPTQGGTGGSGRFAGIGGYFPGNPVVFNNIVSGNTSVAGPGGHSAGGLETGPDGPAGTASAGGIDNLLTSSFDVFFNNTPDNGITGGTGNVYADPQLVSGTDLHILFSSPAKGAGTHTNAPTTDFAGVTRPNPPAIGAYEPNAGGPVKADFNGDGKSDVIWRKSTTGEDAMWLMNGVTISSPVLLPQVSDTNWKMAGVGDFDGDGKADVIWLNNATGQVAIWLMNGTTLSSAALVTTVSDTNYKIAGVGDFNGDGKADVMWRNQSTGAVVVWLMNGTTINSGALLATVADTNYNIVGVGDFNGDGKADLFWRNSATGVDVVWLLNGLSIASAAVTNQVSDLNYKVVGIGDVNSDGKADVAWWNQATGDVVFWTMNGATVTSGAFITQVSDVNWHVEAVGDFDGDGKSDLIWRKVTTGETVVWLMNGTALKQASFAAQVNDLNWAIVGPR